MITDPPSLLANLDEVIANSETALSACLDILSGVDVYRDDLQEGQVATRRLREAVKKLAAILESVESILDESGLIGGSTPDVFEQTEGTPVEWKARALVESWNDQDVAEADGEEIERLKAENERLKADLDWNISYTHLDGGPSVARPIAEIIRERDESKAKLSDMHRRALEAEGLIARSGIVEGRPQDAPGRSLGRALANYAAARAERARDEARAEVERLRARVEELVEDGSEERFGFSKEEPGEDFVLAKVLEIIKDATDDTVEPHHE